MLKRSLWRFYALLLITLLNVQSVQANRVLLSDNSVVEAEFLFKLICLNDSALNPYLELFGLKSSEGEDFWRSRELIRGNLQDTNWYPPPYLQKADYCTLTDVILLANDACDGVSRQRLLELKSYCEN
jgi:hypothetical protein